MLFNSIEFLLFFILLFILYHFAFNEKTKQQNFLLLIASYIFYALANWKILPLLIISTLIFYSLGIAIFNAGNQKKKSLFTTAGVVLGIAVLIYFKYANFFISSFKDLFESIGFQTHLHTFNIIVPVGISFYTFRLLSYVIDINRGKYEPERNLIAFSTYVAFFPCILSGPIDRPNTLIPQLKKKRVFDYDLTVDGVRQILWGMFKKMVIADNIAVAVNTLFDGYEYFSGSSLVLGAILFTFQLYADFSGYTDMAIGVAKLLGFRVTKNFNYPLFAQNIADYWRKWHISLTSWLTDYVFMPLNIRWRNWGKWGMILAIVITFIIIGLWHGAQWTFVLFGLYHGLLYIPLILSGAMFKKTKIETTKYGFPRLKTFGKMLLTLILVSLGLIIFRAETIPQAFDYMAGICSLSLFSFPDGGKVAILYPVILIIIEWLQREKEYGLQINNIKNPVLRIGIYYLIILAIIYLSVTEKPEFIYFQF
jgi:D-alanyl-lipoteichoic acid acyltransferase DltB (MBOAT superfamily)